MKDMTEKDLIEFCKEMINHLEYCGFGDSWEQECAEDSGLIQKTVDFTEKYGD